jgi:hypothetical protein
MTMRRLLQRLEEATKPAKWRMLTDAEIKDELKMEYGLLILFDSNQHHMDQVPEDYEAATKYLKAAPIRDVTNATVTDTYHVDSLDTLIQRHKHMGKDIQGIKDAMDAGRPLPYPIVLQKADGTLKAIGGRHRMAIVELFDYGVKALILNEAEIKAQTIARMTAAFLDGRYIKAGQKDPDWQARRRAIVKWVEAGANGPPPRMTHWTEAEGVRMFAWFVTGKKFDKARDWFDQQGNEL